ncbi:PstS family phosphate ABC transporter substrate-binding protein [Haloplanus aerogenes]|uniref:Phosphate ABC transporter substrate-binding protein PstS family protein n=1 Tax=Haloplanus aerogenes TaxID=660522 RepID=A0A3M0DTR0_9EURY|nr:PstS family phosphate ABC transporter substrate-binding protein [Haloplanus aerogenes]AZH25781.1 phosphate ABC transporter substrate-binding protein PstS family protein [Haloplanus aerogenes]RMB25518.1 phosphate transport system substrate-binding protein [Haloplanus aerogenes]
MTEESTSGRVSRRKFLAATGSVGAVGLAGCTQSGSGGGGDGGDGLSGTIDIAGSSTVFPLATAMAERFQSEHSDVNINIQSTGSGGGFANHFCPGRTDFNNASRPIQPTEEEACSGNDVTPVELTVATDALTVIVNNDNDWVDCITVEELHEIYSAESSPTTWSDVNSDWPDQPLELYGPTDASGTYDYFIEAILGEEGPGHRQDYSATEQDRTIIQGVEGSENAIGYLGFAYYSQNTDRVKALSVDDGSGCVEPSLETARAGEYTPLSRPLFTYAKQESLAEEHVAEFARFWLENATSQEIVADEVGYVPLSDEDQQEAMDALESAIENAQG